MNNCIYENKTNCFFGKGCKEEYLFSLLQSYPQKILIVYEQENDEIASLIASIHQIKEVIEVPLKDQMCVYEDVMELVHQYEKEEIDLIIAIGKEASIQFGKAFSLFF